MKINKYLTKRNIKKLYDEVRYKKDYYKEYGSGKNPYKDLCFNLKIIKNDRRLWNLSLENLLSQRQFILLLDILDNNKWSRWADTDWVNYEEQNELDNLITKLKVHVHYKPEPDRTVNVYINGVLAPKVYDYYTFKEDGVEKVIFCGANHQAFIKKLERLKYKYGYRECSVYFWVEK